jgi:hypothetical protein
MPSFRHGLLLTLPMLLAQAAQAQSNSCELLKQTLAARIPPEIRGYAMDDVPAKTPVPTGGKVIGTCEGGARKVIYRRFGGPPLAGDAAEAAAPASATAPVAVPKEAPKPKIEPPAPAKPPPQPTALVPPAPAPAPAPVPAPVVTPVVVEKPAEPTAMTLPSPAIKADEGPGFFEAYGRWLWLLLALPLGGWLWAWVAHRRAYDSAGLPRGPRL